MFVRTKAVVALLAAGTLVLAGCAGEAKKEQPDVLTLLRTKAAESLQVTLEKTEKAKSASFTVDGKSDGESVKGKGTVFFGEPAKASITLVDAEEGQMEFRILPGAVYVSVPAEDRAGFGGKEWMKFDLASAAKNADADTKDMLAELGRQTRDFDPAVQVKTLMADGKFTVVGEETIDGVKTVHYTGTQPIATYLADIDAAMRKDVEAKLTKDGVKDVKLDVWIDEKYQPRRIRSVVGATEDVTVNFADFGTAAEVAEPPADKSLDFLKLMQDAAKLGA